MNRRWIVPGFFLVVAMSLQPSCSDNGGNGDGSNTPVQPTPEGIWIRVSGTEDGKDVSPQDNVLFKLNADKTYEIFFHYNADGDDEKSQDSGTWKTADRNRTLKVTAKDGSKRDLSYELSEKNDTLTLSFTDDVDGKEQEIVWTFGSLSPLPDDLVDRWILVSRTANGIEQIDDEDSEDVYLVIKKQKDEEGEIRHSGRSDESPHDGSDPRWTEVELWTLEPDTLVGLTTDSSDPEDIYNLDDTVHFKREGDTLSFTVTATVPKIGEVEFAQKFARLEVDQNLLATWELKSESLNGALQDFTPYQMTLKDDGTYSGTENGKTLSGEWGSYEYGGDKLMCLERENKFNQEDVGVIELNSCEVKLGGQGEIFLVLTWVGKENGVDTAVIDTFIKS